MTKNKAAARVDRATKKNAVIVNRKEPLEGAKAFTETRYTTPAGRTLHRHRGAFYAWDGQCYPEIEAEEVRAELYTFLSGATTPSGKACQPNTSKINELVDALKAFANLPRAYQPPCWLAGGGGIPAHEILPCANGLLHLTKRVLLPPTPLFFSHNAVAFAYDPDALDPEAWLKFLDDLWEDDSASINTLQELFGYLLTPDTSQQKIFMLVGPKRSGKGTIGRVLKALLGEANVRAPALAGLGTNFGLAPLIGCLLAIIADARMGGRADQRAIAERLLSISGEDAQTIDQKFRTSWTGTLAVRFLLLTNELPQISDASGALASRFIVLRLTESFYGREDTELTNRLLAELPAILNWSIDGWERLRARGYFNQPESAREAMQELEDLSSPIHAFLRERCIVGPAEEVEVRELFGAWKSWCADQGRDRAGTKQVFGRDLRAALPRIGSAQHRDDAERRRFYQGVGLKNEDI